MTARKLEGKAATIPRAARRRTAVGPPRPTYLGPGDQDRLFMMIAALSVEVSALRERLDTHERLADHRRAATPRAVEAYRPTPAVHAARDKVRQDLLDRVYRVLFEDLESAGPDAASAAAILAAETAGA